MAASSSSSSSSALLAPAPAAFGRLVHGVDHAHYSPGSIKKIELNNFMTHGESRPFVAARARRLRRSPRVAAPRRYPPAPPPRSARVAPRPPAAAHVIMYPSASVNFVLGANGAGKSSIVCALCLGLGGDVRDMERARELKAYIMTGCSKAVIKVRAARAAAAAGPAAHLRARGRAGGGAGGRRPRA